MLALIGPSGSGKTQRILTEFRAAVKARRTGVRLVVPTATLVQHLRNELAREGLVFSPKCIVTLSGFTTELWPGIAEADNLAITLAAEIAVREVNAPEFARVASMPGFHAALVHTLSELDAAGCTPDQFSRIRVDAPFARPLLAVWRNIERQLTARALFTRAQVLRKAADIARQRAPRPAGHDLIWFDGFAGFTRPELQLIEALSGSADITVALPNQTTAATAIADLRDAGFTLEELESPEGDTEAAWFQAENLEREADEIARRILLYNQFGRDFRDIAIVLRSAEELAPLLETTLDRFGIPARFYFSSPLADHPIAGFGAHLIEAMLSGWDLEKTLLALRLAPDLAPSPSLDRWDIAIREALPGAGLDLLRELAQHDRRLLRQVDQLAELDPCRTALWSLDRWAAVLAEIPDRFRPRRPQDRIGFTGVAIQRSQAAATAAWSAVVYRAAEWLRPQFGKQFLSLEEFWRTAGAILRLTQLKVPDARRNVVHVMDAFEARQWDPAVMFMPALVEKVFPRYHPQDPFLPDSAIRDLQAAGLRIRDSRARDEEEACLFDSLVQRPSVYGRTRERCLSYPRRNGRGDENLKSSFFTRVRAVESKPLPARPALATPPIAARTPAPLRNPDLLVRIGERHSRFSPTSLETYAKCPFQFFGTRTLSLQSLPDTPEERLNFLVQGTIVHDTLKHWTPVRGDIRPHFDAVFEAVCKQEHIQLNYRTEVLRQAMLANLESFCENFQTFSEAPPMVEQPFDYPLRPGIQLRGRIDRVDLTSSGGAIVIDYKYSNNTKQNVDDESKLQGVLYTLAARDHLKLKPQATIFLSVKTQAKPAGWGDLPNQQLAPMTAEWLDRGLATVDRMVEQIREGIIQPNPADLKHCGWCDVKDACRYESTEATRTAES